MAPSTCPTDLVQVANLYGLGFIECANEIRRYLHSLDGDGADKEVHNRLAGHLTGCIQRVELATQEQQDSLNSIQQMARVAADEAEDFHRAEGLEILTQNLVSGFQEGTIMIRDQPITSSQASLHFDVDGNNNDNNSNNNIVIDLPQHQSKTILGSSSPASSGHSSMSLNQIHNKLNRFHKPSRLPVMDLHPSFQSSTSEDNRRVELQLDFVSSPFISSSSQAFENIPTCRDLNDMKTVIYSMSENNAQRTSFIRTAKLTQLTSSSQAQIIPSCCDVLESESSCVEQRDLSALQMDIASVAQCQNHTTDVWRPW